MLVVNISIALSVHYLYLNLGFFNAYYLLCIFTYGFCLIVYGYSQSSPDWLLGCYVFIAVPHCTYVSYRYEMSVCLGVIDENDAKFEWIALYLNP